MIYMQAQDCCFIYQNGIDPLIEENKTLKDKYNTQLEINESLHKQLKKMNSTLILLKEENKMLSLELQGKQNRYSSGG